MLDPNQVYKLHPTPQLNSDNFQGSFGRQSFLYPPNQDKLQILACIPWHWHSQENGCDSANIIAQSFCKLGTQLWGEENLNWRSATAFDAVLIILKVIEEYHSEDSQSLMVHMNQYFKHQQKKVRGVTGLIQFEQTGDRLNPPTEIVAVKWNSQQQKWQWTITSHGWE